ncbi:MAG: DUF1330 domain-containing protein [Solirubrobacteraceae bacterium]|nr:DUF1330 domain-containing protein [Solirubrobacteraceae bacterium]
MPVDPTPEQVSRLVQEDTGGPVVMLNLLSYKPDGGRESYEAYGAKALPFLQEAGAEILFAGEAASPLIGEESANWDSVILVRYPSIQAFLDMVTSEDYQAITHLRTEGLDRAELHPLSAA